MYLTRAIDTDLRRLAGYTLAPHKRVSLIIDAVAHAHGVRGSPDGAVFHSEHGSVYTSKREVLRDRKVFDKSGHLPQKIFRWCMRYNTRRRQSWSNLVDLDVFEAETSATLTKATQPAPYVSIFRSQTPVSKPRPNKTDIACRNCARLG